MEHRGVHGRRNWKLLLLLFGASWALGGCGHVAVYQRGRLADPSMDPSDAKSAAFEHVYSVHEGAMGGNVSATSGCGCN